MKTTAFKTDEDLTLKEMIDDFILARRIEGKSERTIEQYKRVLLPFAKSVASSPKQIQVSDIRRFLAECKERDWAEATIWTYHKILNVFFNFCSRRDGTRYQHQVF